MAQRKQKSPTYDDIKATNHVVRMAQKEKNEKLVYNQLGNWGNLVIIVYHDAAWANVTTSTTMWTISRPRTPASTPNWAMQW